MKIARSTTILFLLAVLILTSCAGQAGESPTPDIAASLTAGVGTIVAYFFETQTALAPPASMTPSITPLPSPTGSPLALPTVGVIASPTQLFIYLSPTTTGTIYTPTVNPASLAYGCNNLLLLSDLGIPAGTVMRPGQAFTKEWKVANTGTCEWKWAYRVIFISGNSLSGTATHPNRAIPAGNWTTLRVDMEAPGQTGTYTGYWQLSDDAGHTFGSLLGVSIVVAQPTNTPRPTTATSTSTTAPPNTLTATMTPTDTPTLTPTP
jgi:hypothetical protein